jgi:hypothetical protein
MALKDRKNERIESLNPVYDDPTQALCDLSTTGVCCFNGKGYEKNTIVTVVLNTLEVKAHVVYSQEIRNGFRLGLRFGTLTPEEQQKVNSLVELFSTGTIVSCSIA